MNSVNPQQWVNLVVDEWGTWYDVEPGTNPGFLYQQNTMRDAMVAALTLNIFNKHSDRIMMANIAQTVNVLQAMILTDAQKMVLTPTYYVFKMFKEHQNNMLLVQLIKLILKRRNVLVLSLLNLPQLMKMILFIQQL